MGAGVSGLFRKRCVCVELRRTGAHQGSSAVPQFTGQLLQQTAGLPESSLRRSHHTDQPHAGCRGIQGRRGNAHVPDHRRGAAARSNRMRISGHQTGISIFLPDGTTPLRRDPSDMGRRTSAGRVHADYIQAEKDQRTGISRHTAAGR